MPFTSVKFTLTCTCMLLSILTASEQDHRIPCRYIHTHSTSCTFRGLSMFTYCQSKAYKLKAMYSTPEVDSVQSQHASVHHALSGVYLCSHVVSQKQYILKATYSTPEVDSVQSQHASVHLTTLLQWSQHWFILNCTKKSLPLQELYQSM